MTVNTQITLKDYEGKDISQDISHQVEVDGQQVIKIISEPISLKDILISLLNAQTESLDVNQKLTVHELFTKLYSVDEFDFTQTEIDLIIERAKVICKPLVLGRLMELFQVGKELTN